jgi:integrative and conjugative element protein (TIGR02256 family)
MDVANGGPRSSLAAALIDYLERSPDYPYARVEAVDFAGENDVVDIVLEPELVQDRAVAIVEKEPVRLVFPPGDNRPPSVYSRRDDFPIDLVHTNYERDGSCLCLCIWEENWGDLSRVLTGQRLVERLRDWFARTACETLHQAGQPIEPMIPATSSTMVVPPGAPPAVWHGIVLDDDDGRLTVLLDQNPPTDGQVRVPFAIFSMEVAPQPQGALHRRPTDLQGLHDLVAAMGGDVIGRFGEWLWEQLEGGDRLVVLFISIPRLREAGVEVEAWEHWAFSATLKVEGLLERMGIAMRVPGTSQLGKVLGAAPPADLEELGLYGWRVVQRLDRATARIYAGNGAVGDARLLAIGAGAVGSNVMANANRAGVGTWTVVDNDIVLPHNLVRQIHVDRLVGLSKDGATAVMLDSILAEGGNVSIRADFLRPGVQESAIREALAAADLVIDFSASPAVLGALGDDDAVSRGASIFFNPDGRDLVVFAEARDRAIRLDEIEAQYFLAAGTEPLLADHFDAARIDMVRYANACQDLTRPLPPWQVQTLSGIAAGQLISLLADDGARAKVWRLQPETGGVIPLAVRLSSVRRHAFADFRATMSDQAIEEMRAYRLERLPNETGGVLLGTYDLSRRIVHVVAALPAPADSRQSPTYFIRGAKHLKPLVEGISARSAGVISYVGEWHSHPDHAEVAPSDDDEEVFDHLRTHLDPAGTPYVMAICGAPMTWIRVGWRSLATAEGEMQHG